MKLNANRIFIAVSLTTAIVWLVCVVLVGAAPGNMMAMTGHMMHSDFQGMSWSLTSFGVIAGLFGWSLSAGIFAWVVATLYNFLDGAGRRASHERPSSDSNKELDS